MDQAAVAAVNSAVERVRKQIEEVERRAEAQDTISSEAARKQAAWARTQIALDEEHADLFVHANDALEEDTARKELQHTHAVEQNETDKRQAEADREELDELNASIDELRRQLDAIPERERAAGDDVSVAKLRLERLAQDITTGKRRSKREVDKLGQRIEQYEQALGLEIESPADDKIVFKFTCVDPSDVAREHFVVIQRASSANGEEKYATLPMVPSVASFPALAATFKDDQCVATLLRKARIAFRGLYQEKLTQ